MQHTLLIALARCLVEANFKTVKLKFVSKGEDEDEVLEYLQEFKNLRDQNKIKESQKKDISYWGKKTFKEFTKFIDNLKETKSKTQEKKLKKMKGAELRGENDLWLVCKITSHDAACYYGSGTKWCITEKDPSTWDKYQFGNDFYYFINKKEPDTKIAMNISLEGRKEYWNAEDDNLSNTEIASIEKELPSFKIDEVEVDQEVMKKLLKLLYLFGYHDWIGSELEHDINAGTPGFKGLINEEDEWVEDYTDAMEYHQEEADAFRGEIETLTGIDDIWDHSIYTSHRDKIIKWANKHDVFNIGGEPNQQPPV